MASDSDDEVKASETSASQRRVYSLPSEMVDRIVEYQKEKGFQSEVEAVRRLLDEALKSRDTPDKVLNRFLARLEAHRIVTEAAKDVLVGHPMVEAMRFGRDMITFQIAGAPEITVRDNGAVTVSSSAWVWQSKTPFGPGRLVDPDEVPF